MEEKELIQKVQEIIWDDLLTAKSIDSVNFKPHPYCITPSHLSRNKDSMYLWKPQIEEMEAQHWPMCWMYTDWYWRRSNWRSGNCTQRCNMLFGEHTSDKVLFLQLKCNCSNEEVNKRIKKLVEILQENKVDWIAFVETEEKYRAS